MHGDKHIKKCFHNYIHKIDRLQMPEVPNKSFYLCLCVHFNMYAYIMIPSFCGR